MTKTWEKQHAKVIRFEVSIGANDAGRSIEDFENAIKTALTNRAVRANNVTTVGSYYIIDGKVCLSKDYDNDTQNFKPGATSPEWAGGPPKKAEPKKDYSREAAPTYVRTEGYKKPERDPLTGRKIRADKGVPRGPRKPKEPVNE